MWQNLQWDGLYVGEENAYPLATKGDGLGAWQGALRPAVGSKTFHCPKLKKASAQFINIFHPSDQNLFPHYGYNYMGATRINPPPVNLGLGGDLVWEGSIHRYRPTPESRVSVPSQMLAIGDSTTFVYISLGSTTPPDSENMLYVLFPYLVPSFNVPGVGNWHGDGANMVFCDGHTEFAKQSAWIEASAENRRRWNNDNLPHPEYW